MLHHQVTSAHRADVRGHPSEEVASCESAVTYSKTIDGDLFLSSSRWKQGIFGGVNQPQFIIGGIHASLLPLYVNDHFEA